jgi:penicillin-binding protein 1B
LSKGGFFRFSLAWLRERQFFNRNFWLSRKGIATAGAVLFVVFPLGTLIFYYIRFSALIDENLAGNIYQKTSQVFSIPRQIAVGEVFPPAELVNYLRSSRYSESSFEGSTGTYSVSAGTIVIRPGSRSYFEGKNSLRVDFSGKRVSRLRLLESGARPATAEIEPELITNLFDVEREKRRSVRFQDLPKVLVKAVLAAEDKRFFDHPGLDLIRVLGAAWADLQRGQKAQGASTISMQVARSFFFSTKREWSRKVKETLMALMLEHRFTKEDIFELYANQVYMGNRGSFAIRGFGEAAAAYFGKDVRQVNLAEAAFLAGIIRSPNRYSSAERKPERAVEARDRVLAQMVENKMITPADAAKAKSSSLRVISPAFGSTLTAYFVDMIEDDLLERYSEDQLISESYRIYTTLDPGLQRAAVQAVELGLRNVDSLLARRLALWRKRGEEVPLPQAALIAVDPHTGEVKALVGGRDYASSQLNHLEAARQPGSVFKPFVYASAFESGLERTGTVLTPASTVVDEPTTFSFDGKDYTPNNYGENFYGTVSLREALTHSLNVATVKVAEMAGLDRVVAFAKRAGLSQELQPTPAVALGAYESTPLEIAAGYTAFANGGVRNQLRLLQKVVNPDGKIVEQAASEHRQVMDPRVTYLVTSILEDAINRGTAAVVRARGFSAPAAGKTGTSRDGWFAGYTSNLLCVVWAGFDDNRELGLSGAASAAPIWADFMKRAIALPRYSSARPFERPEGVVAAAIDPGTGQLATAGCPVSVEEVFIAGTEPVESCSLHSASKLPAPLSWLGKLRGIFRGRPEERPRGGPSHP